MLNNGKKPAAVRRDKEKSGHDGGESKENQEASPDPPGEPPKDGGESKAGQDAKSAGLKKRGGEGEDRPSPSLLSLCSVAGGASGRRRSRVSRH